MGGLNCARARGSSSALQSDFSACRDSEFSQPLTVAVTSEKCQAGAVTRLVLQLFAVLEELPAW